MEDKYLSVTEAAKFLSVDRRHITTLINTGKLPAKNVGLGERKFYRVLLSDLVLFNSPEDQS